MVDVAARTGYRYVGFRLIAVTPDSPGYPLMNDKTMMRETKARLADTGIGVHDIEFVRFAPETDVESFLPFLEAGAELSARHVVTAAYDPNRGRLIGSRRRRHRSPAHHAAHAVGYPRSSRGTDGPFNTRTRARGSRASRA
jgi:hypothetical protein